MDRPVLSCLAAVGVSVLAGLIAWGMFGPDESLWASVIALLASLWLGSCGEKQEIVRGVLFVALAFMSFVLFHAQVIEIRQKQRECDRLQGWLEAAGMAHPPAHLDIVAPVAEGGAVVPKAEGGAVVPATPGEKKERDR